MHSLLKIATVLTLSLFWSRTFLIAGDVAKDPLWGKAVRVAAANADWVPGLIVTRSEVLHKGETVGVHETWQRSTLGSKGEVVTETVKIMEDGKDVTNPEKTKNKAKGETKKVDGSGVGNPFDAAVQDRLSLKVMDRSRTITGQTCVGYVFELWNTNGPVVRGTAWLNKETGVPSEIENMTLDRKRHAQRPVNWVAVGGRRSERRGTYGNQSDDLERWRAQARCGTRRAAGGAGAGV